MNDQPRREVAVLNAALDFSGAERAAYLDQACGGDEEMRRRVEELLRAYEQAEGFLEMPPTGVDFNRTVALEVPLTEKPGDKVGRYKLFQQIGEGGCGVVYMAEQEEPVRRRVALKVIKLGMDTKQVIARFEAERQALAMMDHPNIAKVLDAGATETGRPYFVMELVRGIKITEFCDDNKLATEERLKLFIQVCQAIQHAHQKGVIHRDIKPSNILVTINEPGSPGAPKVIDFGIAKATAGRLIDQTLFTAFEQFIGTPAYMSPEQAVMTTLDIDTRSDIYSLGVLLYELLTGNTPFDQKELLASGLDEMRRTIREVEPVKPSTRITQELHSKSEIKSALRTPHSAISSDLDWIVMKCLEKDRSRRYETANGLASDIQRYLDHEPVIARPPSRIYRLQKSFQRNKAAFGAAAGIAAVLLIGMGASTVQAIRATRAEREQARLRQIAQAKEKKSDQVAQFLKDMLNGVGPSVAMGRDTKMLREIVDKTAGRISKDLLDQPEVQIELGLTLAQVYRDLQDYKKMEQTARETLRVARAHFGEESLAVAEALKSVGHALFFLREIDEAETCMRQALALQRKLRGPGSLEEASALGHLADILRHQWLLSHDGRRLTEAETAARDSLALREQRLGHDSDRVAWTLFSLHLVLQIEGRTTEAEAACREALAIFRKLYGEDHPSTAYVRMGLTRSVPLENSNLPEGEAALRRSLATQIRTEGEGKVDQDYTHFSLAEVLERQGKLGDAEQHYRAALEIARREMGVDHEDWPFTASLAGILRKQGKLAEARQFAEEAVAICQRNSTRIDPWVKERSFATLSEVLTDLGDTNALSTLDAMRQVKGQATSSPPIK